MRAAPTGAWELVTEPSIEPVTLAEAKAHARIDVDDDDALVTALISAARQWVEQATGRCLNTQTWRLHLDAWPGQQADEWWDGVREGPITMLDAPWVELRKSPIVSIAKVATVDESDAETVWASTNYYLARQPNGYGRLVRKSGAVWPEISGRSAGAIRIDVVCGYGALASNVPFPIRQAIKMLVAHWYETREPVLERGAQVPFTVSSSLAPYRVMR